MENQEAPLPFLQLTTWPLRDQPRLAMLAALACGLFALAIGYASRSGGWAGVACLLLLLLTWRIWVPVRFEIDARGVRWGIWRRRNFLSWSEIDVVRESRFGLLVEAGSAWWSLFIGAANPDALRDVVQFYLNAERQESLE